MDIFITLLENVNKSRTSANNLSLTVWKNFNTQKNKTNYSQPIMILTPTQSLNFFLYLSNMHNNNTCIRWWTLNLTVKYGKPTKRRPHKSNFPPQNGLSPTCNHVHRPNYPNNTTTTAQREQQKISILSTYQVVCIQICVYFICTKSTHQAMYMACKGRGSTNKFLVPTTQY
jgi:hypothetical protein